MRERLGSRFASAFVLGAALTTYGCSLVGSRVTARDPNERRPGERCGGAAYPLLDTITAVSGLTWVAVGNRKTDPVVINGTEVDPGGEPFNPGMATVGYVQLALFGTSAVYGYVVEAVCASRVPDLATDGQHASFESGPEFPGSVYGFRFGSSANMAASVCLGQAKSWQLVGSVGLCELKGEPGAEPSVRMKFESGLVTQISVLYAPPAEQLTQSYDRLYVGLRKLYEKPQMDRAPLPRECAASFAGCLSAGQRPSGAVWRWPVGSVELAPGFQQDRHFVEVRYTRRASPAER